MGGFLARLVPLGGLLARALPVGVGALLWIRSSSL
jgi:hypothetical protein